MRGGRREHGEVLVPIQEKVQCARALFLAGASAVVFDKAVLQMPFGAGCYIGSGPPSFGNKIRGLEEFDLILLSEGITRYSRKVCRHIEGLKRYRHSIELEEFAFPWLVEFDWAASSFACRSPLYARRRCLDLDSQPVFLPMKETIRPLPMEAPSIGRGRCCLPKR